MSKNFTEKIKKIEKEIFSLAKKPNVQQIQVGQEISLVPALEE